MISFELTEEQESIRAGAHEFAEKEMRPVSAEYDEKEEMPWPVLEKALKAGWLTYPIPAEYGGGGVTDLLTGLLIAEELFWGCPGIATVMGASSLPVVAIHLLGSEEQKRRYLPRFCDPEKLRLGGLCATEPNAGTDVASMTTRAERQGEFYVLNGQKRFISNGGIADLYAVFAKTAETEDPKEGISAFIVEGDSPGLSGGKKEKKMGLRTSHTGDVLFEDVKVPAENLMGEENQGFWGLMRVFEYTRPAVAIGAVAIARAAFEHALKYAGERVQFGKPIIAKQAIRFKLADMAIEIEAARLLAWRAAWLLDQAPTDAPINLGGTLARSGINKVSSMAKAYASDAAVRVTQEAIQVLGGYGYMRDYPVEKLYRDAKIFQIFEGTNEIQRDIIGKMLGYGLE